MSVAKVVGIVALLGGITAGATLISTTSGSGSIQEWRSLLDDQLENPDIYKSKYSENYKRYLVGVGTAAQGKTPEDNDPWWKWSFLNRYDAATAKKGFGNNKVKTWEQLKVACGNAYKGTKEESSTEIILGNDKYQEEEFWRYCSPSKTKIKTIEEDQKEGYSSDLIDERIGGKYKSYLVATHGNDWFWNLKQREFKEYKEWGSDTTSKFKKINEKLNNGSPVTEYDTIRWVCEEVYKKEEREFQREKSNLSRFCSLTGVIK